MPMINEAQITARIKKACHRCQANFFIRAGQNTIGQEVFLCLKCGNRQVVRFDEVTITKMVVANKSKKFQLIYPEKSENHVDNSPIPQRIDDDSLGEVISA
uniref:Uncharacterized protein n=1 Tax=viral metagenome TaxID=1070528 RepID=A0A6M3JWU0_9ZZZZ